MISTLRMLALYMRFNETAIWGGDTIWLAKIQLDHIQNGQLSAIINFNMPDMWQTMPDSWTITIKQNERCQAGVCSEIF